MPAKFVRPYSKGQKNDFRDAEAIAAGPWLPGWQLSFVPLDKKPFDEIAGRPSEVRVEIAYRVRRTGAVDRVGAVLEIGG